MRRFLIFSIAVAMFVPLMGTAVLAQEKASTEPIDLDLTSAPIDSALKILFSNKGLNYSMETNVTGIVKEVHLKGIPFESALKTLLKMVDPPLTYRKEGNVYLISVRKEPTTPTVTTPTTPTTTDTADQPVTTDDLSIEKITMNFMDAAQIRDMIYNGASSDRNYGNNSFGGGFGNSGFGGGFGNSGFGGGFGNSGFGGGFGNSGFGGGFGNSGYGGGYNNNNYGRSGYGNRIGF